MGSEAAVRSLGRSNGRVVALLNIGTEVKTKGCILSGRGAAAARLPSGELLGHIEADGLFRWRLPMWFWSVMDFVGNCGSQGQRGACRLFCRARSGKWALRQRCCCVPCHPSARVRQGDEFRHMIRAPYIGCQLLLWASRGCVVKSHGNAD